MINVPTLISVFDSHRLPLLDLFLLFLVYVIHCSCLGTFLQTHSDFPFHYTASFYSCVDCEGLCDHFRDVPREDFFKLNYSTAASKFRKGASELMYISLIVNISQVSFISMVSGACIASTAHGNHLFHLHQQNKSPASKVKFRQANNHYKGILEAAKLNYANKTKESITSHKLGSCDIWKIANSFTTKVNLLYLLNQNCSLKIIVINSNNNNNRKNLIIIKVLYYYVKLYYYCF